MSDARRWYQSLPSRDLKVRLTMWEEHSKEPDLDEDEQKRRDRIVKDIRKMLQERSQEGIYR